MAKFRKKPVVVEAVQWDGKNEAELIAFGSDNYFNKRTNHHYAETGQCRSYQILSPLDWLIKDKYGIIEIINHDVFKEDYEAVE